VCPVACGICRQLSASVCKSCRLANKSDENRPLIDPALRFTVLNVEPSCPTEIREMKFSLFLIGLPLSGQLPGCHPVRSSPSLARPPTGAIIRLRRACRARYARQAPRAARSLACGGLWCTAIPKHAAEPHTSREQGLIMRCGPTPGARSDASRHVEGIFPGPVRSPQQARTS
jgi:hypothetical protein